MRSTCVISYIRLLIYAGDRIRQKAFPAPNRNLDFTHGEVSNNQLYTSHTRLFNKKKSTFDYTLIINCLFCTHMRIMKELLFIKHLLDRKSKDKITERSN